MQYKKPESVLVVIFCKVTKRCLMLQRQDDPTFWQSVTGSLEEGESPRQTALREVREETGIDIVQVGCQLIDAKQTVEFEIFTQFKHRYAPDVTVNKEHWFYLDLSHEITPVLTQHLDYQWLPFDKAARLTLSWNNRKAIKQLSESNHKDNISS